MMMTMAPEDRVLLRQKAELHRQEQLKALGVEDTLDPKFKPPMEPIEVLKVQIGHGQSKGNEAKEDSKTQSTLKETNHEREQQKEQERKREEQARKKEDAMKPRPFDEKRESFHREFYGARLCRKHRCIERPYQVWCYLHAVGSEYGAERKGSVVYRPP